MKKNHEISTKNKKFIAITDVLWARAVLEKDEHYGRCLEVLKDIMAQGETAKKQYEVIKIDESLWRFKVSKEQPLFATRCFYTKIRENGQTFWLFLEIIHNHKYENSFYLRHNSRVIDARDKSLEERHEEEDKKEDIVLNNENPSGGMIFREPTWYGGKFLVMNDLQEFLVETDGSFLCNGPGGGGKTLVAEKKGVRLLEKAFLRKEKDFRILYLTKEEHLIEKIKNDFEALPEALELMEDWDIKDLSRHVCFKTYDNYLMERLKKRDKSGKKTFDVKGSQDCFDAWYEEKSHPKKKKKSSRIDVKSLPDKQALWEEFELMGFTSKVDYQKAGAQQMRVGVEQRPKVWEAFEDLLAYIKENNLTVSEYCKFEDEETFDVVVVDEVQKLSLRQRLMCQQWSKSQLMMFMDTNQDQEKLRSGLDLTKVLLNKNSRKPVYFFNMDNTSYRTSKLSTELSNLTQRWKYSLAKTVFDKDEIRQITTKSEVLGQGCWLNDHFSRERMVEKIREKFGKDDDFVIVCPSDRMEAVKKEFGESFLFYPPGKLGGLEFRTLLAIDVFDEKELGKVCKNPSFSSEITVKNRSKNKSEPSEYAQDSKAIKPYLVMFSRIQNNLLVWQKDEVKLRPMMNPLKEIMGKYAVKLEDMTLQERLPIDVLEKRYRHMMDIKDYENAGKVWIYQLEREKTIHDNAVKEARIVPVIEQNLPEPNKNLPPQWSVKQGVSKPVKKAVNKVCNTIYTKELPPNPHAFYSQPRKSKSGNGKKNDSLASKKNTESSFIIKESSFIPGSGIHHHNVNGHLGKVDLHTMIMKELYKKEQETPDYQLAQSLVIRLMEKDDVRSPRFPITEFLRYACIRQNPNLEFITFLVENIKNGGSSLKDSEILFAALESRSLDLIKLLVSHGADLKALADRKRTCLHWISQFFKPDFETVKYLAENGVDPSLQDEGGNNCLHELFQNPNPDLELVQYLIEKGADPKAQNTRGQNCLHLYCKQKHPSIEVIKFLVEKQGLSPELTDEDDNHCLHYAIHTPRMQIGDWDKKKPGFEVLAYLWEKGADPFHKNSGGKDCLRLACEEEYVDLDFAKRLLELGIKFDLNKTDNDGNSYLSSALWRMELSANHNVPLIKLLFKSGVHLGSSSEYLCQYATVGHGYHPDVLFVLINNGWDLKSIKDMFHIEPSDLPDCTKVVLMCLFAGMPPNKIDMESRWDRLNTMVQFLALLKEKAPHEQTEMLDELKEEIATIFAESFRTFYPNLPEEDQKMLLTLLLSFKHMPEVKTGLFKVPKPIQGIIGLKASSAWQNATTMLSTLEGSKIFTRIEKRMLEIMEKHKPEKVKSLDLN